ncbi:MAG TPA: molybdopterin-guanine dinucleotide biosynthesis protein B [Conexivisphaerales archaeon]|nr:molybdopterin-guanine dinucleotide biosynthesis protein B [Conexivisphaerales archaeon]
MKTVFVVGTKDSGKTTVAEFLVKSLSDRGYKVGTIKHIHHEFTMDTEGKDTYRMREAGSQKVVSFSPNEIAIIRAPGDVQKEFEGMAKEMEAEGFDFLVVEGFKMILDKVPRQFVFLTCRTTVELDGFLERRRDDIDAITGVVGEGLGTDYKGVPVESFPARAGQLVEMLLR